MKTNGEENIKGNSWADIEKANKPSKPKNHKFDVGDQLIITIGAVSRPDEKSGLETDYLMVGGKSDEWIGEETLTKAIPLKKGPTNFVSGFKAGYKDGWEDAQKKDQEYMMQFLADIYAIVVKLYKAPFQHRLLTRLKRKYCLIFCRTFRMPMKTGRFGKRGRKCISIFVRFLPSQERRKNDHLNRKIRFRQNNCCKRVRKTRL